MKWVPTSDDQLERIESRILGCIKSTIEQRFVTLPKSQNRIWTIIANKDKPNTPLVMVHGMGGGVGLWCQNIDHLARHRPVYAFDLLGFGRSSRPTFSSSAERIEMEFVESIEEWRQEMKIEKMALLGHSLGAYLAGAYALKYPEKIQHLFLVDPWGYSQIPNWVGAIAKIMSPFHPLTLLRTAGPMGPYLSRWFQPGMQRKFAQLFDDHTIPDYIYHCNAQTPSGESAFRTMSQLLKYPKRPMLDRLPKLVRGLPITFIFGRFTWIDIFCANETKLDRLGSFVDLWVIDGAGHNVHMEEPELVNNLLELCLLHMDRRVWKTFGREEALLYAQMLVMKLTPAQTDQEQNPSTEV